MKMHNRHIVDNRNSKTFADEDAKHPSGHTPGINWPHVGCLVFIAAFMAALAYSIVIAL